MELIRSTLFHKIKQPSAAGTAPSPAVILLHGRGSTEDDLLGLIDYLDPRFFFVSARAPYAFPGDFGGHTWYDLHEIGSPNLQQFEQSYAKLMQFLDDVRKGYPIDQDRIFLFGFSMGSVMSFAAGLTAPHLVKGIVAHSGYIPETMNLAFDWKELTGLSVFVAHGVHDPVIPIEYGRRAQKLLSASSADLTYNEYPISHTISEESLADISAWLEKRLAVPADMK